MTSKTWVDFRVALWYNKTMKEGGADDRTATHGGTTMAIIIDTTRGFDVMRGTKVLKRCASYEEAWAYAAGKRGAYVRYWEKKGS